MYPLLFYSLFPFLSLSFWKLSSFLSLFLQPFLLLLHLPKPHNELGYENILSFPPSFTFIKQHSHGSTSFVPCAEIFLVLCNLSVLNFFLSNIYDIYIYIVIYIYTDTYISLSLLPSSISCYIHTNKIIYKLLSRSFGSSTNWYILSIGFVVTCYSVFHMAFLLDNDCCYRLFSAHRNKQNSVPGVSICHSKTLTQWYNNLVYPEHIHWKNREN